MYYSIYANERLAIQHWDSYDECNWLLTNFLTKHYEMPIDEMVDFYLAHRNERYLDEDSYVVLGADELLDLYEGWQEYQNKKYYYEDYMDDFNDSDEDVWNYRNPRMAYQEFQYNEYYERMNKFFDDKSFVRKLISGEDVSVRLYDWLRKDNDELAEKFEKRMIRNKRMGTKLREIDEVVFYKSDFDIIEKAKKNFGLTELQVQAVFGLIFMSRMNNVKYCRIGTEYKSKGFWSSFDKHISLEDKKVIFNTGLFERYITNKGKTRKQLNNQYHDGFADYLHIEDENDYIYKNFDNKDEVIWVFHTTVKNNRLNFTKICKEALPNLKNKYCSVCGKEFVPTNNKQKQCGECRDRYKAEQARLRKQKQRAIKKGLIPNEPKNKKLSDAEYSRREEYEQMYRDFENQKNGII